MIYIICALEREARPLITYFSLKGEPHHPFPLYRNDAISLIVSGTGKVHAAAATSYLHALHPQPTHPTWINIGIGGHRYNDIGTGFLIHKITDQGTGRSYFPGIGLVQDIPSLPVLTVDQPTTNYDKSHIYDMEASGFFATASRFSTVECIQCYKVISDNAAHPFQKLHNKKVSELIQQHMSTLDTIIHTLLRLSQELENRYKTPQHMDQFLERWHHTQTQKIQLEKLLKRWNALYPNQSPWDPTMKKLTNTKQLLHYLEKKLHTQPLKCFTPSTLNRTF